MKIIETIHMNLVTYTSVLLLLGSTFALAQKSNQDVVQSSTPFETLVSRTEYGKSYQELANFTMREKIDLVDNPGLSFCSELCVSKVKASVKFHTAGLDGVYELGGQPFDSAWLYLKITTEEMFVSTQVHFYDTLKINFANNQMLERQVFEFDFTDAHAQSCEGGGSHDEFWIDVKDFQAFGSNVDSIRLDITITEEYAVSPLSTSSPLDPVIETTGISGTNPVLFSWDQITACANTEYPNYQIQVLRLYNTNEDFRTTPKTIEAIVDWSQAYNDIYRLLA